MKCFIIKALSVFLTVIMIAGYMPMAQIASAETATFKTGDLITFGSYPQSEVKDVATLSALNGKSLSWKSYGYYSGDGNYGSGKSSDYMKYADVTYNGNKYRAVKFTSYRPWGTYAACAWDSSYSDQGNNGYYTGTVYWFKYKPIVWRVIDPVDGLLMTENIIDSQPFENDYYYRRSEDGWRDVYGDSNYNHYASLWKYSSLRDWLNDDFYNISFSGQEKGCIRNTELQTEGWWDETNDELETTDKVFLLSSREDAWNESYGFSSNSRVSGVGINRVAFGTDYAKCQGLKIVDAVGYSYSGASYWHLRDAIDSDRTHFVTNEGDISSGLLDTSRTNTGVRPALIIDLQSAISQSLIKPADIISPTGSISSTNNVAASQTVTLTLSDNEDLEGYYWGTSADFSNNAYTSTSKTKETKTISDAGTYYLTVEDTIGNVSENYSITFYKTTLNENGGSVSPTAVLIESGKTFTFPTPQRSGYTYNGWSTSSSATSGVNSLKPNGNSTYYAAWKESTPPTGSILASNNVAVSQTVTLVLSDNAGVAGYYWGTSSTYADNTYTSTSSENVTKTISDAGTYYLTVKDTSDNVSENYSITFYKTTLNANGGSVSSAAVLTKSGDSFTFPTPKRSGYTYNGWSTSSSATSGVTTLKPTGNNTYYAVWNENTNNIYTVNYDANGGTGTPSSQKKTKGVSLTLSSITPTKTYTIYYNATGGKVSPASKSVSCAFNNWNTAKNGSGNSYAAGASYTNDADVTLYAQWQNPSAGSLAKPTRSGYAFSGWYTAASGGKKITSTSAVSADITVYAHWTANDIYNLGEETYSFENYGDTDSPGGHCFGMSMTSSGYYLGLLDFSKIGGNADSKLYSFSFSSAVKAPICYYHSIQGSYSNRAIVAGGSWYLTDDDKYDISADWREVINYVKNHEYDNTGKLQIGFRKKGKGGHAINFLRYENVNGQDRIYAYDNNFPTQETYFYMSSGAVYQAPVSTFGGSIDCIALRDVKTYFSNAGSYDASRVIYCCKEDVYVRGLNPYVMDGYNNGKEYVMYEIPEGQLRVIIIPLVDNADFIYKDTEYSFGMIDDDTYGEFRLESKNEEGAITVSSFKIYNASSENPGAQNTFGDVNCDGQILANDARLALRASAQLENLDATQTKAADVDEDGKVLANDARQILRFSAKLQTKFAKASENTT